MMEDEISGVNASLILLQFAIIRGGVLSPKSYVDVPAGPRKSDYLYTNFLPNFPPISIPFSEEKHPIWIKLGAFYNNLPKIHPIYVIWAPSSLMKTPRSLYQISRKGAPKGRHIYVYHVNVRTPPGYYHHHKAKNMHVEELWFCHCKYSTHSKLFLQWLLNRKNTGSCMTKYMI